MPMHTLVKSHYCKQNELFICWYLCVFTFFFLLVIVLVCFCHFVHVCVLSWSALQDVIWRWCPAKPRVAVPTLNTWTPFLRTVWETRLLNQGVGVWRRVVLTQIIILIPARDGKRGCQLMLFEVTHKIGEEEVKSTLLILSSWFAKGKAQKPHDPPNSPHFSAQK